MVHPRLVSDIARQSVVSVDSIQSVFQDLEALVEGSEEDWLYSPRRSSTTSEKTSALDWLNANDGNDSCYDTEGEGDDDLSLLLSGGKSSADVLERLGLNHCPSPAPSSIWAADSRPGSRMRHTPDLSELGFLVKNDGQMDDTDDLVTSPTIEFKSCELDNEDQWRNASDLHSPVKTNFVMHGRSPLATQLLRKNQSVADLRSAATNQQRPESPMRLGRLAHANNTFPRSGLSAKLQAMRDENGEQRPRSSLGRSPSGSGGRLPSSPLRRPSLPVDETSSGTDGAAVKPSPLRHMHLVAEGNTTGEPSSSQRDTLSPLSSSPDSSFIDTEDMNWHLDETISLTSQSSFHSMEDLTSLGPKPVNTTNSIKNNLDKKNEVNIDVKKTEEDEITELEHITMPSNPLDPVTDAWLNSTSETLDMTEPVQKPASMPALRSPRPIPLNNLSNRGEAQRAVSPSPSQNQPSEQVPDTTATSDAIPISPKTSDHVTQQDAAHQSLQQIFAASRTPAAPRRGHAPSKSGPITPIRPVAQYAMPKKSDDSPGSTLRTRKSIGDLHTNQSPMSPPGQRSPRQSLGVHTAPPRSRSVSPSRPQIRHTEPLPNMAPKTSQISAQRRRSLIAPPRASVGSRSPSPNFGSYPKPPSPRPFPSPAPTSITGEEFTSSPSPMSPVETHRPFVTASDVTTALMNEAADHQPQNVHDSHASINSATPSHSDAKVTDTEDEEFPFSPPAHSHKRTLGLRKPLAKLLNPLRLGRKDDSDDEGAVTGFFRQTAERPASRLAQPKATKSTRTGTSLLSRMTGIGRNRPPSLTLESKEADSHSPHSGQTMAPSEATHHEPSTPQSRTAPSPLTKPRSATVSRLTSKTSNNMEHHEEPGDRTATTSPPVSPTMRRRTLEGGRPLSSIGPSISTASKRLSGSIAMPTMLSQISSRSLKEPGTLGHRRRISTTSNSSVPSSASSSQRNSLTVESVFGAPMTRGRSRSFNAGPLPAEERQSTPGTRLRRLSQESVQSAGIPRLSPQVSTHAKRLSTCSNASSSGSSFGYSSGSLRESTASSRASTLRRSGTSISRTSSSVAAPSTLAKRQSRLSGEQQQSSLPSPRSPNLRSPASFSSTHSTLSPSAARRTSGDQRRSSLIQPSVRRPPTGTGNITFDFI